MSSKFLEPQVISTDVLLEKYAKNGETSKEEIYRRVCNFVATAEKEEKRQDIADMFYYNMLNGAIGAGRIMAAAGTNLNVTLINCFVQSVGDAITGLDEDGNPGIYDALTMAAETLRRGGGVGYDFSEIRPKAALVKSVNSYASGPCSYMDIFNASCKTIESAGFRRGAQMGILKCTHPDILDFITAKRTDKRFDNFNISVFVTDEFMQCKDKNGPWELVHKARPTDELIEKGAHQREDGLWVYRVISAKELWDTIMKSNYDYAEPGILFEDTINNDNNLRYCEYIKATNPCSEQPLPPYGCCDLGQIILPLFVSDPFTTLARFNWVKFSDCVKIHVRFLDNVLDVTQWPLEQQKQEAMNKRRIGLGFTGLGNTLAMLNLRYDSEEAVDFTTALGLIMRNDAYKASIELAKEKGYFPLFVAEKYLEEGTFASRLPDDIKEDIRNYGIRNSHLLSIAPTGTISLAFADNASNGIEPPFSLVYKRKKRNPDNTMKEYQVIDYGLKVWLSTIDENEAQAILDALCEYKTHYTYHCVEIEIKSRLPKSIVTAQELTADAHMAIPAAIAPYIDSSLSKTINVPEDYSFDDFKLIYDKAYKLRLKGISTYRPNTIIGSILEVGKAEEPIKEVKSERGLTSVSNPIDETAYTITNTEDINLDFLDNHIKRRPKHSLESVSLPVNYHSPSGNDKLYIIVSWYTEHVTFKGVSMPVTRPIEVFITAYPEDVPAEWIAGHARNLSLLARAGLDIFCKALKDNRKVKSDKGRIRYGQYKKAEGGTVPRFHDSIVACIAFAIQELLEQKGIIDENGNPFNIGRLFDKVPFKQHSTETMLSTNEVDSKIYQAIADNYNKAPEVKVGKKCSECGDLSVIRADGCERCTNCGWLGSCG